MATLSVLNREGKEIDKLELPENIFSRKVNQAVLYDACVMYHLGARQGTVNTKERADVSGGGKKPYRQKGTGRARVGSTRSPLWKGGGVTFGPHPREFRNTLPKKMRKAALRESLNAKYQASQMICIEEITDKFEKTKEVASILTALKLQGKVLAVLEGFDRSVVLASRNIPRFQVVRSEDVNANDVLKNKTLLVTKTAVGKLLERIGPVSEKES